MATIYEVRFANGKMEGYPKSELFMTIEGAKKMLSDAGYYEVTPEDFADNTKAMWKHDATFFFAEHFAFIGTLEVNE